MFLVPVFVLGLGNGTVSEVTRHLRGHLETVLTEDYIRTARAKGARLWRHLYKDAFVMPLSSLVASKTPYTLGGAVIVEQVFNWPRWGRLAWQAALDRDNPVLLGTLVAALVIRVGHMLKQATQVAVNPQPCLMSTYIAYVECSMRPTLWERIRSRRKGKSIAAAYGALVAVLHKEFKTNSLRDDSPCIS